MMRYPLLPALTLTLLAGAPADCDGRTDTRPPTGIDATTPVQDRRPVHLFTELQSGYAQPAELVLRDAAQWSAAWRTLHGGDTPDPAPAAEFGREMVVLVALGTVSTGGYAVSIDSVTADGANGGGGVVHYTVTAPGPGCMTTQAQSAPADAVRVPRAAGAVRFERRTVREPC